MQFKKNILINSQAAFDLTNRFLISSAGAQKNKNFVLIYWYMVVFMAKLGLPYLLNYYSLVKAGESGGTGRRAGFRIQFLWSGGSNPPFRIIETQLQETLH